MLDAKTTTELGRELGVQTYRLAYAVQTGALPAPQIVAGRRLWTPHQAEAARAYFEALRRGPNRGRGGGATAISRPTGPTVDPRCWCPRAGA